ncbi:hypothetical protein NQ317_001486, partial [Molorchus minor]
NEVNPSLKRHLFPRNTHKAEQREFKRRIKMGYFP